MKMSQMTSNFNTPAYRRALKEGYRSGLEVAIAADLKARGVNAPYEPYKIAYVKPETMHKYTPDFVLPNGIVIESKGRFVTADRKKHLLIRESNPKLDLRFVFSNSRARISKKSKTTYAAWCSKNQFKFADKLVPQRWIDEVK